MGKIFLQVSDVQLGEILASVRHGDEVVLLDGERRLATVSPAEPTRTRDTFGMLRHLITKPSDDSIVDPIPPEELGLKDGYY